MVSDEPVASAVSARDEILARVRANRPEIEAPQADEPSVVPQPGEDLAARFAAALERMGGRLIASVRGEEIAALRAQLDGVRVVCSRVSEIAGTRDASAAMPPSALDDVDYAIVRASFGVAETGSVCLTDRDLGATALGYLAQHLVVLLDPADILATIHDAYRHDIWRTATYAVLHTGPSATADIEGVLVHGAQGVRSLSVLLLPRG